MRAGSLSDEEIRGMLGGGVNPRFKRELEEELSWRAHTGRQSNRPSYEYVPAWLLAQAERRR